MKRLIMGTLCLIAMAMAVWFGQASQQTERPAWIEIAAGVWKSPGWPAAFLLVDGEAALLIDAPENAREPQVAPKRVLLTHPNRESVAGLPRWVDKIPVLAAPAAAEWLERAKVQKYWLDSLPLRNSRTAYLVPAEGFDRIDYSLSDGKTFSFGAWKLTVLETPGASRGQVSLLAQRENGPKVAFVGGLIAEPGKIWAPYATDWDHWTDAGLAASAKSLQRLLERRPDIICPAYGPVIAKKTTEAISETIKNVEEVGFLKSFERFTKNRLGNAPKYDYLVPEQAMSNGSKPWSRVSEHLWLTGNTYVLVSKDNALCMIDPWDKRGAEQFFKLQKDRSLGSLELVMFSHAHYDHFDGVFYLPDRDKFQIWALDQVAKPIAEPYFWRAPFLDSRPIRFDRQPKAGETLAWREYKFRFHHLPGQSEYTMGVETTIDGKHCLFTADNWFHQDMYSGSGGWMGLNRSFPPKYAASAQKVLDIAPEWVLAEHGGPFEFNAEDFRRRVQWGEAAGRAADALSPSGQHLHDWNPHRVRIEPLVHKAKAGEVLKGRLVIDRALTGNAKVRVQLQGRGIVADQTWEGDGDIEVSLPRNLAQGRHVFTLRVERDGRLDPVDAFVAVDIPD